MGNPPAPHLANAWMSQFDDAIKGTSKLYSCCMDYIFCYKKKQESSHNLNEANNLHHALKWTMERKQNGGLPMLHTDICNN